MSRDGEPGAPTLAGLLNALDGVNTPHGLITIINTNYFEKLDPALVRPGRVDYRLELKKPVQSQVEDMFYRVFEEPLGLEARPFESMAQVAEVFKRSLDDPEAVRIELKND
jgi:chaperone BCS1